MWFKDEWAVFIPTAKVQVPTVSLPTTDKARHPNFREITIYHSNVYPLSIDVNLAYHTRRVEYGYVGPAGGVPIQHPSLRKIRGGCVPGPNVDLHLSCGFGGCLLKSFDCFALAFHFFGGGLWYLR